MAVHSEPVSRDAPWARRDQSQPQAKRRQRAGRRSCVGEPKFERLPQPCSQAGPWRALHPREPFLVSEEGAGCLLPCPVHGEKVGKGRRRVKGAISSYACGLHKAVRKAGEYERRVQESQRWWGSTKDGQKWSELAFPKTVPCTCQWGNVASGRAGSGCGGCQHWPEITQR